MNIDVSFRTESLSQDSIIVMETTKRENYILQSISFDKTKYSQSRAKQWMRLNDYIYSHLTEDDNRYYFQQLSPDNLTDTKIKPMGKTDINFIVMNTQRGGILEGGKRFISIMEQPINEKCLYCI